MKVHLCKGLVNITNTKSELNSDLHKIFNIPFYNYVCFFFFNTKDFQLNRLLKPFNFFNLTFLLSGNMGDLG